MKRKTKKELQVSEGITPFKHGDSLRDFQGVLETFQECLLEGDDRAALEVLAGGLHYLNKSKLARKYKLPRRTLYNFIGKLTDPSLSVVAKVCHALAQESRPTPRP